MTSVPHAVLGEILAAAHRRCSRLAGADEDRVLARLPPLRSDRINPTIVLP
jgi:hypothetical protein